MVVAGLGAVRFWWACSHKQIQYSGDGFRGVGVSYPPGPCPFLANWTRCSGVKSVNRRFGLGGGRIWPGFNSRFGPFCAIPKLGGRDACVRQADQANHNPTAASSAAIARERCFGFIVFCCDSSVSETFAAALCAVSGNSLSIWNEGGELRCEAPAIGKEPR
jgi:hypothetical protein